MPPPPPPGGLTPARVQRLARDHAYHLSVLERSMGRIHREEHLPFVDLGARVENVIQQRVADVLRERKGGFDSRLAADIHGGVVPVNVRQFQVRDVRTPEAEPAKEQDNRTVALSLPCRRIERFEHPFQFVGRDVFRQCR